MEALRGDVGRIRQIAAATLERARRSAGAAEDQRGAMQELAATSQQTAGTAATLDALAGRFRVAEPAIPAEPQMAVRRDAPALARTGSS
jgi:hypothetical protein